jgi:hypothetical protein
MDKPKPTVAELVERAELLEEALERMLGALKDDLRSLRADLRRLEPATSDVPPAEVRRVSRPLQHRDPHARPPAPGPQRTISEELSVQGGRKDPRSDE